MKKNSWGKAMLAAFAALFCASPSFASEANLVVPNIQAANRFTSTCC